MRMWLPPNLSNVIVPAQPSLTVGTTTATSISLSWTSAGSEVDSYEVMWQRDTSGECPDEDEDSISLTDGSTSYDIMGLEEDSSYSITVTASNAAGSAVSNTVTAMTLEAGEIKLYCVVRTSEVGEVISQVTNSSPPCAVFYSLQLLLVLPLQLVPLAHPPPSLYSGEQWTASTAMET